VKVFSILGKVGLLVAILAAFIVGLFGTIRLSLHNPEVKVPNIVGKDRATAEAELASVGLSIRQRMTRYVPDKSPNTVLDQTPQPGAIVKKGLPIAVIVARAPKEGEAPDENANAGDEETPPDETANANSAGNSNASVPKKKPVNKNANSSNKNGNKNANGNRNANANLPGGNRNLGNANAGKNLNANRNANNANRGNANKPPNANANGGNRNRRATPEPR
jgi:beta-lactam-binding protein with PASTA domain